MEVTSAHQRSRRTRSSGRRHLKVVGPGSTVPAPQVGASLVTATAQTGYYEELHSCRSAGAWAWVSALHQAGPPPNAPGDGAVGALAYRDSCLRRGTNPYRQN